MEQLSKLEKLMDLKNEASPRNVMGRKYKIVEVIFPILVFIGLVMLFMNINIVGIDGKTMLLLTAFLLAAYQDGVIRKLCKQITDIDKETI